MLSLPIALESSTIASERVGSQSPKPGRLGLFLCAAAWCPFSTWLPPWLAKADSGSYWHFAIVYLSIVRRKQAEKALALSAFFLAFGCGSSCGATPVP